MGGISARANLRWPFPRPPPQQGVTFIEETSPWPAIYAELPKQCRQCTGLVILKLYHQWHDPKTSCCQLVKDLSVLISHFVMRANNAEKVSGTYCYRLMHDCASWQWASKVGRGGWDKIMHPPTCGSEGTLPQKWWYRIVILHFYVFPERTYANVPN